MIRLSRYLRPFTVIVGAAVFLLFLQALADLSLPHYTGDLVNVGIQQNGIEDAVPVAARQSTLDQLVAFMSEDDAAAVLAAYTLHDPAAASDDLIDDYPALANEPVYVLDDDSDATLDTLDPIMGRAWMMATAVQQAQAAAAGTSTETPAETMTPEMQAAMMAQISETVAAMPDSLVLQSSVVAVKNEYTALGMDVGKLQNRYILKIGLIMLAISFVSGISAIAVGYLASKAAAGVARNLRRNVFHKVESFSNFEFDKFSVSSLITRTTNDITQLQMLTVIMIRMVIYAPIMGFGGIIMALNTDATMWWTIALAVGALMLLISVMFTLVLPKFRIVQRLTDRLNQVARENLSGMMVIRAFNTQDFEEARFDRANRDLTDTNLYVSRAMAAMMPFMMLIMNLTSLMIIWVGAHEVSKSTMQVGDMIAFMQYAMQVVMSFLMMSFMFIMVPRASVSAERIADVLETDPVIKDPAQPKSFPTPFDSSVEFRNVSFRYPGAEEDVLCGIDFTAHPGEMTAIIGSTGSGKSTLVNLIPRFYDVSGGSILISGVDIREVEQHALRDKIGYNPQKAVLFSGTIASNLRYADEHASEDALNDAIRIAQASDFITEKPDGVETEIAQGGVNVSGGQRQRLTIARSLVKNPPIYVFDDSFSALDYKTDAALRRALRARTQNSTVIVISQRVATIMYADQIIVLDQGEIVGKGTHSTLLESCDVYREIAQSQLNMEELAS